MLQLSRIFGFIAIGLVPSLAAKANDAALRSSFLADHCVDCHQGPTAEAGLDLVDLRENLEDVAAFDKWVKIFDRVRNGEMPPKDAATIDSEIRNAFALATEHWLHGAQAKQQRELGRVGARRLTNLQLERTLHDLLGIDIPLEREMPEDPKSEHFSTLARQQSISHFHMEQHIKIVDLALDEAIRRALTLGDERVWEMSAQDISRTRERTREPEFIDNAAVVWSSALAFYGRLPATTANVSGWYRFQFEVSALNIPAEHGVCSTIRSGQCVSSAPLMSWVGSFEATEQPQTVTIETWLPKGHMLEIRPADSTLKLAKFQGGQSANGEGGAQHVPGIAIHWLNMERIHRGPTNEQIRGLLFGNLLAESSGAAKRNARSTESRGPRRKLQLASRGEQTDASKGDAEVISVVSDNPLEDGEELIERFAMRAFRRPVSWTETKAYLAIFEHTLEHGGNPVDALRTAYRAILCSARFMYLHEEPGPLDQYALAARLSYFLWNSMPDAELIACAQREQLTDPSVIKQQLSRMLRTSRGSQFIADFANEWLELDEIDFTVPDRKLYPDFDITVQNAMLEETNRFLQDMLDRDANVQELLRCDYAFVNSRLARFYELPAVSGNDIRRVSLPAGSHRGGLLAQGAILKVTANGTNTSPVLRGVWVSRRILGRDIPPPPSNVPAIEPDIRGAKTIRQQLEKHRALPECSSCHAKIDAPGFALENFDASGKWREYYPQLVRNQLKDGMQIDASYVTDAGQYFSGFESFCELAADNPLPLAKNLLQQWLVYGTGETITFADRREIDAIVSQLQERNFGIRSILEAVVTSHIFMSK